MDWSRKAQPLRRSPAPAAMAATDGPGETRAQLDQDTAEFDMTAVLSEGGEAPQDEIPARNRIAGAATDGSQPAELTDDSLDWDFPSCGRSPPMPSMPLGRTASPTGTTTVCSEARSAQPLIARPFSKLRPLGP